MANDIIARGIAVKALNQINAQNIIGTVTSALSSNVLIDDTKNFEPDALNGKTIKIIKADTGIEYQRTITSCVADSIQYTPIELPINASVILGNGEDSEGQVIIECIGDLAGSVGNDYSIQVIEAEDIDHSGEDTIVLDTDTKLIIITCYKNALGESRVIGAGTIENLINNTEGIFDKFYVANGFTAGNIPFMAEPESFVNGEDGIYADTGDTYFIQGDAEDSVARSQIASLANQPIIEATANRVISVTDLYKRLHFNSTSNLTCTIPPDADLTAEVGASFTVMRMNTGTVTFVAGTGVIINSFEAALAISGQYAGVIAYKTAANTWMLVGALE